MGVAAVCSDLGCQTLHRYCRNSVAAVAVVVAVVAVVAVASAQRKMCVERFQVALRLSLLRLWPRKSFEAMVQIRVGCVRKNSFKKKGWSYDLASLRGEEVGSTNEIRDFKIKPTI